MKHENFSQDGISPLNKLTNIYNNKKQVLGIVSRRETEWYYPKTPYLPVKAHRELKDLRWF